jgi:hypothetical protein
LQRPGRVVSFAAADEAGTQVGNVGSSVEDSDEKRGSRIGGDEFQESVSENMDNMGKVAESAAERLLGSAGGSSGEAPGMDELGVGLGDAGFRRQVAMAADASAALETIAERAGVSGGVVGNPECSKLIMEALALGNSELAFSVLKAMRSNVTQRRVDREGNSRHLIISLSFKFSVCFKVQTRKNSLVAVMGWRFLQFSRV